MPGPPLLALHGLQVRLPNGELLLDDLELEVAAGEIVALVGPSGAGKSTLIAALFEPERLRREGLQLSHGGLNMNDAALVPQQGAVLDHLSVLANVELPERWHGLEGGKAHDLLADVGLSKLAGAGSQGLSGGERQRLAIARALAAGRHLLILDEPSAGLDPLATQELSVLLRRQCDLKGDAKRGVLLVSHDPALVAAVADRALFLNPQTHRLAALRLPAHIDAPSEQPAPGAGGLGDPGPVSVLKAATQRRLDFEGALQSQLLKASQLTATVEQEQTPGLKTCVRRVRGPLMRLARQRLASLWSRSFAPLELPTEALLQGLRAPPRQWPAMLRVAGRLMRQALLRPSLFYGVVSTLLGYTLLYVLARAAPEGVSSVSLLKRVGGLPVLALTPPLSALLFVATSGAAVSAWLGSLSLGRQLSALRALGISRERYLWAPGFPTLIVSYWVVAAIVALGLALGGALLHLQVGAETSLQDALSLILGDLLDPVPERWRLQLRAIFLLLLYAPGLASDLLYRGSDLKRSSDEVTRAMTRSVVVCTLWVVCLEFISALLLFNASGPGL